MFAVLENVEGVKMKRKPSSKETVYGVFRVYRVYRVEVYGAARRGLVGTRFKV